MRLSKILLVAAITSTAAAAPIEKKWFPGNWWQATGAADSIIDFIKRHPWPGVLPPTATPQQIAGRCDLSQATLPQAPKPLPPVSAGFTLYHVAVGRGTQNYTCDTTNSSSIPAAVGAVATLFNASCMAATNGQMLGTLSYASLNLPKPSAPSNSSPVFSDISGHHYFTDLTTPYFNLDTTEATFGQGPFKKLNATNAPSDAPKGQDGQGDGAVAWLKLAAKSDDGCTFQEVYRVNTAGGNPPATCAGMPAAFEVQYSAEYWMFSKPADSYGSSS